MLIFPFHEESNKELNSILRKIISHAANIVVVDDGSNPPYSGEDLPVKVLRNEKRLGKGAAIMRAISDSDENIFEGAEAMLTADSDGQHCAEDILRALEIWDNEHDKKLLISGSRKFSDKSVPRWSRVGRFLSSLFVYIETGENIFDTQNGLRIYPLSLFRKFKIRSKGFGFETETLVKALRAGFKLKIFPIKTIYPHNRKSHFRLLKDSLLTSILHASLLFGKEK